MLCLEKGDTGADEETEDAQKRTAGCSVSWRGEEHCCSQALLCCKQIDDLNIKNYCQ
jgi:hypothetical protein